MDLESATRDHLERLQKVPVIAEVLARLKRELPAHLKYHSYEHTIDVMAETIRFALKDDRTVREIELLAIAAAYHDAGWIKSPVANEPIGAAMAREALEQDGSFATSNEIELIQRMILDTALIDTSNGLKQVPNTDLSRYLLDADLGNFGRDDFFDKGELQRLELGVDPDVFRKTSFKLLNAHRWLTNAAMALRQKQKEHNVNLLRSMVSPGDSTTVSNLAFDRLGFLARLSLLLNSSLEAERIIDVALTELQQRLDAQAATIFLLDSDTQHLTFWALQGERAQRLEGVRMPADKGIVGWVISNQQSIIVDDVDNDPRFFKDIDREVEFKTRNVLCVPLTVRGERKLGAVQILNATTQFNDSDLDFVEQFANQVALAIDNARLFEAVQQRNKQLELLDQRKNEMISIIAHEFRTPLNLIGTSAELLASRKLSDPNSVDQMCGVLTRGVKRLTKLISDIRNLSLTTSDHFDVNPEEASVSDIFLGLAEYFMEPLSDRKLAISFHGAEEVGKIRADPTLVSLVMQNLVSNAIRYTPDEGTITVRAEKRAGLVTISVQDTGIGIEKEQIPLIFEKFYEVTNSMNHKSGSYEFKSCGLGLGLATVRSILTAHGSAIQVSSIVGKGSTFSFSLSAA